MQNSRRPYCLGASAGSLVVCWGCAVAGWFRPSGFSFSSGADRARWLAARCPLVGPLLCLLVGCHRRDRQAVAEMNRRIETAV
jgi:hypothetical protein